MSGTVRDLMGLGMAPALAAKLGSDVTTAVAAAGTAQGTATALLGSSGVSVVSTITAASADGVVLPTPVVGDEHMVVNSHATAVLNVYPATGGAINGLATNAAFKVAPGTSARFIATSTTTWYTPTKAGGVLAAQAAAGTTQGAGTAIPAGTAVVEFATITGGSVEAATLFTPKPGDEITVINSHATAALKIFPAVGGSISNGATDAVYSMAALKTVKLVALSATKWWPVLTA